MVEGMAEAEHRTSTEASAHTRASPAEDASEPRWK